jgi:hypothetical protein
MNRFHVSLLTGTMMLALAACTQANMSEAPPIDAQQATVTAANSAADRKVLKVGDPGFHPVDLNGPRRPDPFPEEDLSKKPEWKDKTPNYRAKKPKKDKDLATDTPDVVPGQWQWGTQLLNTGNNQETCYYAAHQIQTGLNLPQPPANSTIGYNIVYAPTMMPADGGPLEAVTIYSMKAGTSVMVRQFGVWNHSITSGSNWVYTTNLNANFQNYYTTWDNNRQMYTVQIWRSQGNMAVYLWNYVSGTWDQKGPWQAGSRPASLGTEGWNMFETYLNGTCPFLPTIEADYIQVNPGKQGWRLATGSNYAVNRNYDAGTCNNYVYTWLGSFYHWRVSP